jgi:rRNA maturation endonuclease Nob1
MSSKGASPAGKNNPPDLDNTSEVTLPSPHEIQEVAQRKLASLTEEKRAQLRVAVMRTMSEEQRQQAAATKKDPLIQYILQQARQDIMSRNLPGQVDIRQQLQEQHQRIAPDELQSLVAQQRGLRRTDVFSSLAMIATQPPFNDHNTAAPTVATSSSQDERAANIALRPKHKCANCGGLVKPRSASRVADADEQDKESPPFNYCEN